MQELALSGGYKGDLFNAKRLAQTEAATVLSQMKELLEAHRRTAINKTCEFTFVVFSDTTLPEKMRGIHFLILTPPDRRPYHCLFS
jgi:hypothetical protein